MSFGPAPPDHDFKLDRAVCPGCPIRAGPGRHSLGESLGCEAQCLGCLLGVASYRIRPSASLVQQ